MKDEYSARWKVLACASLLVLASAACSNNDPGSQPPAEDMATPTPDMATGNNTTPAEDMKQETPEDMAEAPVDMATPEDMPGTVEDMETIEDMPADMMAGDMTSLDMPADMPEELDMLMYPDADQFECAYPSSDPMCPTGAYGPGAFITKFEIVKDNTCCRDFDNDGMFENFIGAQILPTAEQVSGVSVNQNLAESIDLGETVFLFEFEDWQNDQYDPSFVTRILTGTDTDGNMLDNKAGMGAFYVSPDSYDEQGAPLTEFMTSRVHAGDYAARGSRLRIYFPGLLDAVNLTLTDVHIDAKVVPGADLAAGGGVELIEGELSGALLRDEFYESINLVSNKCACLARDIYIKKTDGSYECAITQDECTTDPDSACRLTGRADICFGLELYSKRVDLDSDGDGKRDSFSFGARFEAVPTELRALP